MKLKLLDLFSGIGGFSLGLESTGGFETVAFCEIDPFCQKVLNKHWPKVPIYNDIREVNYNGAIDVICGGFPCQPFSVAGKRKGKEDNRYLWPEMFNIIKKHRPSWVIGENVTGIIEMGLQQAILDLESEGYEVQCFIIPACAVDAPHRRDRVWIIAHTESTDPNSFGRNNGGDNRQERQVHNDQHGSNTQTQSERSERQSRACEIPTDATDPDGFGSQRRALTGSGTKRASEKLFRGYIKRELWSDWQNSIPSPRICRSDDGISDRTYRLKALGNAVVPQLVEEIGNAILSTYNKDLK